MNKQQAFDEAERCLKEAHDKITKETPNEVNQTQIANLAHMAVLYTELGKAMIR